MKPFSELFEAIDSTTSTLKKVAALVAYFEKSPPADAAWAVYFLSGRKINRLLPSARLVESVLEISGLTRWMFDECYSAVGDLAETIASLAPARSEVSPNEDLPLHIWVERLTKLKDLSSEEQIELIKVYWKTLSLKESFLMNKLLTGSFRAGVSSNLVVRALSQVMGVNPAVMSHRLMGKWNPTAEYYASLKSGDGVIHDPGLPFPFYLASPLEDEVTTIGDPSEWLCEWKWDGIRAQAIRREGGVFLWSRGEEILTERFPEITENISRLPPGTVLDGEILAYDFVNRAVLPFSLLQQRIGRLKVTAKMMETVPVTYMVFDILESEGRDLRTEPLSLRRQKLETVLAGADFKKIQISPQINLGDWESIARERSHSRERKVEGLMLKRLSSPYRVGRKRGDWWKWKVEPYTMDAVLLYAQPGHGRRATLYTDYTFGVWSGEELVPIAKAYSGLSDAEILELDRWIRANTREKFGPVRSVPPVHVFELAFEAISASPRHKSGVSVRFPRILRRRLDKKITDADTVDSVRELLNVPA
jgi:DNA ligase-1